MKILIVSDRMLYAGLTSNALERVGVEVVDSVCSTGAVQGLAAAPDVAIIDLSSAFESFTLAREMLRERPTTKIVCIGPNDAGAVRRALDMGVSGYITQDVPVVALLRSIRAVAEGQVVIPSLPREQISVATSSASMLVAALSPRETQVLSLLVEGLGGREVARRLQLSPHTVRSHVQNVFTKLHAHSRLEAVSIAVRAGVVPESEALGPTG